MIAWDVFQFSSCVVCVPTSLLVCDKKESNVSVLVIADLFSLFASEQGGYAARDDMEAVLRVLDGEVPPSLRKCFSEVSSQPNLTQPLPTQQMCLISIQATWKPITSF